MKVWVGVGVIGIGLLSLIGWRWKGEVAAAQELKQQQGARRGSTPAVEIARAETRAILDTIETVGTLESPFRARLSPRTAGRVVSIDVREGDLVSAGQVLVRVDPQELDAVVLQQRASVSESRARLAEAQARFASTESEVQTQISTQEAALSRARADLEKAERNQDAEIAAAEAAVDDANAQLVGAQAQLTNAAAEVRAAQADLANATARKNRVEELSKLGYVAAQDVEDASLQVESKRAALDVRNGQRASAEASITAARARKTSAEKRVSITIQSVATEIKLAKAAVAQAEAALAQARANRSRTPAFRQNLRALEAGVASADAELSQAASRRSDTELRAPFKGTVTERAIDPGSLATPGQSLVVIEAIDWLYVSASVPVESANKIAVGKAAEVRLDAYPGQVFSGVVDKVNRAADPQSRQVELKIKIQNPDGMLRPGAFAKVRVIVGRTDGATVVPAEAVRQAGDSATVMVVTDKDEIEERTVTIGGTDRGGIEILTGVQPGDRVVVLSYQAVKPGQKVNVAAERGAKK
jgi:RND family efflux transporter MFP subunit